VNFYVLIEARQLPLERLHEVAREALRLGERQLAELGASTRHGPAAERRGVQRQADQLELARQRRCVVPRHVRDHEILHAGRPDHAGAVALGELGGSAHLLGGRSEEHTSELQSRFDLVCRLLLEKKKRQSMSLRYSTIPTHTTTQ